MSVPVVSLFYTWCTWDLDPASKALLKYKVACSVFRAVRRALCSVTASYTALHKTTEVNASKIRATVTGKRVRNSTCIQPSTSDAAKLAGRMYNAACEMVHGLTSGNMGDTKGAICTSFRQRPCCCTCKYRDRHYQGLGNALLPLTLQLCRANCSET